VALRAVRIEGNRFEAALIRRRLVTRLAAIPAELGHLAKMNFVGEVHAWIGFPLCADDRELGVLSEGAKIVAGDAPLVPHARQILIAARVLGVTDGAVNLRQMRRARGAATDGGVGGGAEPARVERVVTTLAAQVDHGLSGLMTRLAARVERRVHGRDRPRRRHAMHASDVQNPTKDQQSDRSHERLQRKPARL